MSNFYTVAQQPIVRLHHVEIAVLREFDTEPVGGLAVAPGAERIDHDDVVAVGVDWATRADDGISARERGALDPLLIHVGGIAGIAGADDYRVGDLAGIVATRRPDRDIGGPQLAATERFQCLAAFAAELPGRGIREIVATAELKVRNLAIFLEAVVLLLRGSACKWRVGPCDGRADDQQQKTGNKTPHRNLPLFWSELRGPAQRGIDLSQGKTGLFHVRLGAVAWMRQPRNAVPVTRRSSYSL